MTRNAHAYDLEFSPGGHDPDAALAGDFAFRRKAWIAMACGLLAFWIVVAAVVAWGWF